MVWLPVLLSLSTIARWRTELQRWLLERGSLLPSSPPPHWSVLGAVTMNGYGRRNQGKGVQPITPRNCGRQEELQCVIPVRLPSGGTTRVTVMARRRKIIVSWYNPNDTSKPQDNLSWNKCAKWNLRCSCYCCRRKDPSFPRQRRRQLQRNIRTTSPAGLRHRRRWSS